MTCSCKPGYPCEQHPERYDHKRHMRSIETIAELGTEQDLLRVLAQLQASELLTGAGSNG